MPLSIPTKTKEQFYKDLSDGIASSKRFVHEQ